MVQTQDLAVRNGTAEIMERVLIAGDLAKLTPAERVNYYNRTCDSLGLNPLTKPFEYIALNGKLTLYATRTCTDQLRATRGVSIAIVARDRLDDVYVVTARATTPDGRTDESTGVVSLGSLRGDNLANALMKAETKAKRRVTLSICGLGWMDETETETVRGAERVGVDDEGEIQLPVAHVQAEQRTHEEPDRDIEQNEAARIRSELEARWQRLWLRSEQVGCQPKKGITPQMKNSQVLAWCDQLEDRIREVEAANDEAIGAPAPEDEPKQDDIPF